MLYVLYMRKSLPLGLLGIALALTAFVAVYAIPTLVNAPTHITPPKGSESRYASLTIEGLYDGMPIPVETGETLLRVLERLNEEDTNLQLGVKEYAGLGTLVTSIGGRENGTDDKYWQYEVNGVMPMIGADQYIPKEDEDIRWFFDTSQQ